MSVCARVLAAALMAGAIAAALSFPAFVGDKAAPLPPALTAPPAAAHRTVHVAAVHPVVAQRPSASRRSVGHRVPVAAPALASVRLAGSTPTRPTIHTAAVAPPHAQPRPSAPRAEPRPPAAPTSSAPQQAPTRQLAASAHAPTPPVAPAPSSEDGGACADHESGKHGRHNEAGRGNGKGQAHVSEAKGNGKGPAPTSEAEATGNGNGNGHASGHDK
jgi:hypothetical protein